MDSIKQLIKDSWPSDSNYFLLAIQVSDIESRQFHIAMLYLCEGQLMIGDLQSHMRTRRGQALANKDIFWISPDLSSEDQKILASKLDSWLILNKDKIPYSVAHPGGVIFRDDLWVGNDPAQGLTCATFVVELFNELAIPFIDKTTWKKRHGDDDWANRILKLIECIPEDNKNAQISLIGETIRIRPSDTFAAGMLIDQDEDIALSFDAVSPYSEKLENNLIKND